MFGLEDRHLNFVHQTLDKYLKNSKYYIFGSRADGTYKEYSDIDIAIDMNTTPIPIDILGKLMIEFEDSTFPYEVDIVDLNSIDEKFKNLIKDSLVEF